MTNAALSETMLSVARRAVADACVVCRAVQREIERVRSVTKDDRSPVTVADFASQAVIAHRLREIDPSLQLVGEENADALRATPALLEHVVRAVRAAPVVVASRSHRTLETDDYLAQLPQAEILSVGSSLKFCMIASGQADYYPRFGPTMQWDTAAGDAVLADVRKCLASADAKVRELVAKAEDEEAVPELIVMLYSADPAERMLAEEALRRLTGRDFGYQHFAPPWERDEAADAWRRWWLSQPDEPFVSAQLPERQEGDGIKEAP